MSASLLSLKCKVKKAATFIGLFISIPDAGAELTYNKGSRYTSGGEGGREEGGARKKRQEREECMEERDQMQIIEVSSRRC